ncbi:MAG: hypothetical protein A2X86_08750 [Bdellovibrionales bacterium GWA2_49_15]|nr:MAG: hypothetical protein A2X86_08750 [Bdellovibrionales bacterium GWA2_49_15]HAZ13946.1 hypothetical protein [Bdellovibrionales bacterium]
MKLALLILSLMFSIHAFAGPIAPCGQAPEDKPEYNWVSLAKVIIHAKVMNANGLICAGLVPGKVGTVDYINYRDEAGTVRSYSYEELSTQRRILLSQEDLGVDLVRKGPIMSLHVVQTLTDSAESRYNITLRFLRNLSRLDSSPNDYRELNLMAKINQDNQSEVSLNDNSIQFDQFDLFISLGLTINKVSFTRQGQGQGALETKILPKVGTL